MAQPVRQTEHSRHHLEPVRIESVPVDMLRDGDVAKSVERRQQIKALENEANLVPAEPRPRAVVDRRQIVAVHEHFSASCLRQASDHVEKGGLSAARRTHHSHEFARQHLEIHAPQRR